MSKLQFRLLVIISTVLAIISACVDLFYTNSTVDLVNNFIIEIEQGQYDTWDDVSFIFALLSLSTFVVSFYGLLAFKSWGRTAYVISFFLSLPLYFTSGLFIVSGAAQLLYDIAMINGGIIFTLTYCSPVKDYFSAAKIEQS